MAIPNFYNGLLRPIGSKVICGYRFNTSIQTLHINRQEFRVSKNPYPLFTGRLTDISLSRPQLDYLNSFFIGRRGREVAFRWNDPIDNYASPTKVGMLEYDPNTYTIGGSLEPPGLNVTKFYPAKIYSSHGYICRRPIHLPVGPVQIYSNGVFIQNAVPNSQGYIPFVGSTTGLSIAANFDIPVRFGINEIPNVLKVIRSGDLDEVYYRMTDIPLNEDIVAIAHP
jgi:uncharacterized protein (TIGR02217 family)